MHFSCELCNYYTDIRCNYEKHLNTKKHLRNNEKYKENPSIISKSINFPQFPSNSLNLDKNSLNFPQFPSHSKNNILDNFKCEYCNTFFTRKDNLNRHSKKCKNREQFMENNNYKLLYETQKQENDKFKAETKCRMDKLYNQIDKLIDRAGDTNITQNNLILNSYGNEDLSHITDNYKTSLLKIPFGMIPKLIEKVHFNNEKPENKNIYVPNKKEPYIKVFNIDKWVYKDKKEIIKNLVNSNYNILDDHYENQGKNELDRNQNKRYINFQNQKDDGELEETLTKEIEILILNYPLND